MIKIHLYTLLQEKGWTQRELARRTAIREATISEMCNNCIVRVNILHLNKICKELYCKIEDILEYIPDSNSAK